MRPSKEFEYLKRIMKFKNKRRQYKSCQGKRQKGIEKEGMTGIERKPNIKHQEKGENKSKIAQGDMSIFHTASLK